MSPLGMLHDVAQHDCSSTAILASDDPKKLRVGFLCSGCGRSWHMKMNDFRPSSFPPPVRDVLSSADGRDRLAKNLQDYTGHQSPLVHVLCEVGILEGGAESFWDYLVQRCEEIGKQPPGGWVVSTIVV